MNEVVLRPIGVIHTPHLRQVGTPIQPAYAQGVRGTVTLLDEYVDALAELAGFDCYPGSRAGWLDEANLEQATADDRFRREP